METGVELHSIRANLGQPETIQRNKQQFELCLSESSAAKPMLLTP